MPRFQLGTSGNPNGRPSQAARELATITAALECMTAEELRKERAILGVLRDMELRLKKIEAVVDMLGGQG